MKKTVTYGFMAALLLAGACAKIDLVPSVENEMAVSFSTYGQRLLSTKADTSHVAPGADFAEGAVIGLYGFYHDASTWADETAAGTNIPDFMYHTALTKQSDGSWTYSPIKYWPNQYGASATSTDIDRLSFWGYYPRNASGLSLYAAGTTTAYDNATSGLPKAVFTQQEDPDDMVDLMFSEALKDLYKTQSHTVNTETHYYGNVTDGEVTLTFKHALALVEFQLAEGTGAEISSLSLTNIYKTGTLEDPTSYTWTDVQDLFNISMTGVTVSGSTTILSILAVPQTIEASATFTMNYDIQFASSDPSYADPIVYKNNSISAKLYKTGTGAYGVTAWEAGKHYIYKVAAGLDRIEFEEVVESSDDWSVGNSNIEVSQ